MKQKLLVLSLTTFSLLPGIVLAGLGDIPIPEPVDVTSIEAFYDVLVLIANVIFTILMIVAVIMILLAAFYYLTASGEQTKLDKAKNTLIYAGVAIAVALIARGIPLLVRSILV
ncbi:MAG: hypothetical protein ACK4NX_00730 [Candidatus Paceibacteria bacterium]